MSHSEEVLPEETEVDAVPAPAARRAPRALVVLDRPQLAGICTRRLSRIGVRATVVGSGREAVALLADAVRPIAFACVDEDLRDGTGRAVLAALRRLRPSMPVLVVTTSIDEVLTSDGIALCAPFTEEQFDAAYDAALLDEPLRHDLDVPEEVVPSDAELVGV